MGKILGRYILPHPPILLKDIGGANRHIAYKTCDSMNHISKEISDLKPKTIIVISPHGTSFSDGFSITDSFFIQGDFTQFGSTLSIEKDIDKNFVASMKSACFKNRIPLIPLDRSTEDLYEIEYKLDHGAMVPLFFIDNHYTNYKLVSITYGGTSKISHYKLGMIIEELISQSNDDFVIIASGDLSHRLIEDSPYGYHPSGEIFDKEILDSIDENNIERTLFIEDKLLKESYQCGLKSIYVLLGTLHTEEYESQMLSYEHPFGVGYCVCRIKTTEKCETKFDDINNSLHRRAHSMNTTQSQHAQLAREAINNFVKFKSYTQPPENLPKELSWEKKGVFVSIKMDGELRGCIGTLVPTCERVCDEIVKNAIESCSHDPRFSPVTEDELPFLSISVDVLEDPESCSLEDLDPYDYGIIVSTDDKKGVLLPNLEGIDTVEEQVSIALQKGGIEPDEKYTLERFRVTRHV